MKAGRDCEMKIRKRVIRRVEGFGEEGGSR
jgi:hypothetical protein